MLLYNCIYFNFYDCYDLCYVCMIWEKFLSSINELIKIKPSHFHTSNHIRLCPTCGYNEYHNSLYMIASIGICLLMTT